MFDQKPFLGAQLRTGHPLASGLVGAWLMNERGGNKVIDASVNGNHGTLSNGTWVAGGIDFIDDGSGEIALTKMLTLTQWTFIVKHYLRSDSYGDWNLICGVDPSTNPDSFWAWKTAGIFRLCCRGNFRDISVTYPGYNTWQTWATTYDGDVFKAFLDGQYKGQTSNSGDTFDLENIGTAFSGAYDPDGIYSYFYVFDRALTSTEIASLYSNPYQMWEPVRPWIFDMTVAAGGGQAFAPLWQAQRNNMVI